MRKQMIGAERRQWVEKLLDQYAPQVYASIIGQYPSIAEAEDAFVYIFALAISRLHRDNVGLLSETWFAEITAEVRASGLPSWAKRANPPQMDDGIGESVTVSSEVEEPGVVPSRLRHRAEQMMRAQIARDEAMRHHKGPVWARIGAVSLVVIGLVGVGYGISGEVYAHFQHRPSVHTKTVSSDLPYIAGNLSAEPVAVYSLDTSAKLDLSHVSVGNNQVYVSSLIQSTDSWPRMNVQEHAFGHGDQSFASSAGKTYSFELVSPLQDGNQKTDQTSDWKIADWRVEPMAGWLAAVVTWSESASASAKDIKQIYALNLGNGKYSLVDTLTPQAGLFNRFVVAVGKQKIAIQSALEDGSGVPPLGLPIQIYTLKGADPLKAFTQTVQIPASFGLMESPVITPDGILFQGIAGKQDATSTNTETWHQLSWDGTLTQLSGPPVDGQPHYAVRGITGDLWWVETTPDASGNQSGYQVSMASLSNGKSSNNVKTLDNSVNELTVSGSYMLWTQQSNGGSQLVVAQVQ